jgi:AmmeMemoRadiSam system protein B/AmmeMemoRadiSam system protein A
MSIREPAVAGTFYPADEAVLRREVEGFLAGARERARPIDAEGRAPKALIVPHAGYVYSGPVAASAYACLAPLRGRISRVVIFGPAHRIPVRGLAVLPVDAMRTPLGLVPIDHAGVDSLADLPQVERSERAHRLEHSLEVQLPFLQEVLGEFSVVPLVVGDATDAEVAEVFERLWGGPETLFVVSSDLSHYHDYETARRLDAAACRAIEALDAEALDWESACGRMPIRGLLRVAQARGLVAHTLDLRSSGDTAGPRDQVVGYGAWAFAPARHPVGVEDEERKGGRGGEASESGQLLDIARRSIAYGLHHGSALPIDPGEYPPELRRPGATFVTIRDAGGALRGCIGSLEPRRALVEDVAENAWAAAFRDSRFPPVGVDELPELDVHVSILGPPEALAPRSREELVSMLRPGRDGLILEDQGRRATFLPQVWESVPDPAKFVGLLWRKAGLPEDHWSTDARAWRYEARDAGTQESD